MRPVIVKFLNELFNTQVFNWLVPDLALIYSGAVFICIIVYVRRSNSKGLSEYYSWGAALLGSFAGIIGVRLWYLLLNLDLVFQQPSILFELNGSTISFGGYIFGMLGFVSYLKIKNQDVFRHLDAAASILGLGIVVGRIGCFFNGDDFGTITQAAWGVRFPPGSYPFVDQVNNGLINFMASNSLPVHPVQLYLSLNGLALFLLSSYIFKNYRFHPGFLFFLFWFLYGVTRFCLEFFRGDYPENIFGILTSGQMMCLFLLLASLAILLLKFSYKFMSIEQWQAAKQLKSDKL